MLTVVDFVVNFFFQNLEKKQLDKERKQRRPGTAYYATGREQSRKKNHRCMACSSVRRSGGRTWQYV
jgi:hypothetical protein